MVFLTNVRKTSLWVGILVHVCIFAQQHSSKSAQSEKVSKSPAWNDLMERLDAERTKTLYNWEKIYHRARKQEPPKFIQRESLQKPRTHDVSGVDKCLLGASTTSSTFSQVLSKNLDLIEQPRRIFTNSDIDRLYHLSEDRVDLSLVSHKLCVPGVGKKSHDEFFHAIHSDNMPTHEVKKKLTDYLSRGNAILSKVHTAQSMVAYKSAISEYKLHHGVMMACLAYTESLGAPDSQAGNERFAEINKRAYVSRSKRPEGVSVAMDRPRGFYVGNRTYDEQLSLGISPEVLNFKDDKGQERRRYLKYPEDLREKISKAPSDTEKTKLKQDFILSKMSEIHKLKTEGKMSNAEIFKTFFSDVPLTKWPAIGVYQFKFADFDTEKGDVVSSNIGPCVDQWNNLFGSVCPIAHTMSGYAEALSSPGQAFNMFCGTQKILQSYNVQVHTTDPTKTSPQNLNNDGTLKSPQDRCVHPFWHGSHAYNHFGPLANSAPKGSISGLAPYPGNLFLLMECVENNVPK